MYSRLQNVENKDDISILCIRPAVLFRTKQEQTLFKRSAAGFEKVLIVWQSFTGVKKEKS